MQPKNPTELAAMRESGKMLATVLEKLAKAAEPGLTPQDLSALAAKELKQLGGEPAFLGFQGYPDVICISVNDEVQHAIPSKHKIKKGDVVNFDFGVSYRGMITDAGATVGVGKISEDAQRLLDGTRDALVAGIAVVKDGGHVKQVSQAIEKKLSAASLGIVKELVGHGVGHSLHEPPEIPNYVIPGYDALLRAGMTICIEPITTLGSPNIYTTADNWTFKTVDGSWSAQFEHTVLVTKDGAEILTEL